MNRIIILILMLGFVSESISQTNSHIQIVSEPGISIFLDGLFKGKTDSDYGGLIIQNVNSGKHIIKVIKEGYLPREETIMINEKEVFTYQVDKNFLPAIKITEQGNKENQALSIKSGDLKFQSLPIEIKISIQDLGINALKSKDEWLAEKIPEGTYKVTFKWKEKELTDDFVIEAGKITYAFINFLDGKIESKSSIINTSNSINELNRKRAEDERQRQAAEQWNSKGKSAFGDKGVGNTSNSGGIGGSEEINENPEQRSASSNYGDIEGQGNNAGFGLGNRNLKGNLPLPLVSSCTITSKIIIKVQINVDREGNVVGQPKILESNFQDDCVFNAIIEAASKSKFTKSESAFNVQQGWIRYIIEP